MKEYGNIISTVKACFPTVIAIYLFGTWCTEGERADSDIDIALLFPVEQSNKPEYQTISDLHIKLENMFHKNVDILNVRRVSTVFQKEIIGADRKIYCADKYSTDEFEMLVLSYYQKLNDERRKIVNEFIESKRAYAV